MRHDRGRFHIYRFFARAVQQSPMSEYPPHKIVMVEAKSSWVGKLMSHVSDGKYIEIYQGKSFRNNEQKLALAHMLEQASLRDLHDLPVECDEWCGC